jgi:hypothetical protein
MLVPKAGLEPARGCPQRFLRPQRLPFRHSGDHRYDSTPSLLRQTMIDRLIAAKNIVTT